MDSSNSPEDRLAEEFRALGKNLADALHTAWERPERKELQLDIERGLKEFGEAISVSRRNFPTALRASR